jgi:prepilin-type N-terminal cleavage/methylation domain-containing protein
MKAPFKHTKGFTLIEILVALTIVSVGVLALGSFSISTLGSGQTSRERLTAVHLAEQFIEEWQQTDILPTLDANYCKTTVAWTVSTAKTALPCPVSGTTTTSVATCTPLFGTKLSYTISATESRVCGPPSNGGNAFKFYSATPPNSNPKTKLVNVSWTRKGKTRAVFLTNLSKVP